jgi:hypothetical protein
VDGSIGVQVDGTGTLASVTMALYENGVDVSATKLSGSASVSGRVITTKTLASLIGGSFYKWYLYFTDDGVSTVREGTIQCVKLGVRPSSYPSVVDNLRIVETPILIYPGQSIPHSMVVEGEGIIGATPTMSIYKVNTSTELSSTLLSGALSVLDRTITLKTIGSLSGGSEYIWYVFFTDAGKSTVRYGEILAPKLGA